MKRWLAMTSAALTAGLILSAPAWAADERAVRVENELNCISNRAKNQQPFDWQDVCSTQSSPKREQDIRKNKINEALEQAEHTYSDDSMKYHTDGTTTIHLEDKFERTAYYTAEPIIVGSKVGGKSHLRVNAGYRRDELDWNIAGDLNGQNPNVLSELQWELDMIEYKAEGQYVFLDSFVLDGMVAYSDAFDGENQDSDYLGNNRTFEFSRSNNQSDAKAVDYSTGIGYRMNLDRYAREVDVEHLWVTALAGYSRHELDINITDGFQTIPATGAFDGLASQYDAQWDSPWVGLEALGSRKRLSGFARFEYHLADYEAEADWNLRPTFQHPVSFRHEAEGYGMVFKIGMDYEIKPWWTIGILTDLQTWKAKEGVDRTFFTDQAVIDLGLSGNEIQTRLNEVNWDSMAFMFSTRFLF